MFCVTKYGLSETWVRQQHSCVARTWLSVKELLQNYDTRSKSPLDTLTYCVTACAWFAAKFVPNKFQFSCMFPRRRSDFTPNLWRVIKWEDATMVVQLAGFLLHVVFASVLFVPASRNFRSGRVSGSHWHPTNRSSSNQLSLRFPVCWTDDNNTTSPSGL